MRNENPLAELADTGHRGQKSAKPMSGSNPDAIDEGAIITDVTDES